MDPSTSVVVCELLWWSVTGVWARGASGPRKHPNVTSGDLLEYADYSEPITPSSYQLPPYMRHDQDENVVVTFTMHYGEEDKIVEASNDDLKITKKLKDKVNLSEIWHIHQDDIELKQFFSKVLEVDPMDVTVVHIMFSKEESMKKLLVKERVMNGKQILEKLIAAEGKII